MVFGIVRKSGLGEEGLEQWWFMGERAVVHGESETEWRAFGALQ